jgi:hypothetical protein
MALIADSPQIMVLFTPSANSPATIAQGLQTSSAVS